MDFHATARWRGEYAWKRKEQLIVMRYFFVVSVMTLVIIMFSFFRQHPTRVALAPVDSLENERNIYMRMVLESIKGKENWNADSVFSNLKTFKAAKGFTAKHFLEMMNIGWGKGLGVSCTYCHNSSDWASDEKVQKQIGRDMYDVRKIVNDRLKQISNLPSGGTLINCVTCHRGKPIPVTD